MENSSWMSWFFFIRFTYNFPLTVRQIPNEQPHSKHDVDSRRVYARIYLCVYERWKNRFLCSAIQFKRIASTLYGTDYYKNGFPDTDEPTKQENLYHFPSYHCASKRSEAKTLNFMLLRTRQPFDFFWIPSICVRNSIDSVTTIRARINCTQREKYHVLENRTKTHIVCTSSLACPCHTHLIHVEIQIRQSDSNFSLPWFFRLFTTQRHFSFGFWTLLPIFWTKALFPLNWFRMGMKSYIFGNFLLL